MFDDWCATAAEVGSPMPGDGLIEGPAAVGTRAIDVMADHETVFDFLAQMGFGRAGWYSCDLLDNLGRRSATTVNAEWVVDEAGAAVPGGPVAFVAAVVERPSAYVLQLPQRGALGFSVDFVLAYRLDDLALDGAPFDAVPFDAVPFDAVPSADAGAAVPRGVRLVSRATVRIDGPGGRLASRALLWGDGVMVRRQLLGIKKRCEAVAQIRRGTPIDAARRADA